MSFATCSAEAFCVPAFFSIRRVEVKRFRTFRSAGASGLSRVLLPFGIGSLALPAWDQKDEGVQSVSHPNCDGRNWHGKPGELTSSIVPRRTSSTGWRNFASPFDGDIFRQCGQAAAGMLLSLVQRNSVPSLHMRCMITASLRASATFAFLRPRRLATFIAQAFSHDHFFVRVSMT
jgi:hypothetical protein